MSDEQRDHEEDEQESRRPRVVDKRISARKPPPPAGPGPAVAETPATEEPAETLPAETPPAETPAAEEPAETFRPPGGGPPPGGEVWTPEQEAEAQRIVDEIDRVPSRDWVVSAAMNLVNVAGVKLDRGDTDGAQLAIDALRGMLETTGTRLGDAQGPLKQVLAQLQMAYAQAVNTGPGPGTA